MKTEKSKNFFIGNAGNLLNEEKENDIIKKIIELLVGLTHEEAENLLYKVKDKLYREQKISNV